VATSVNLTPELDKFAHNCVSEFVLSGLRLLQETEERRARFGTMLDESRTEAGRDGTHDIESIAREMDSIIAASKRFRPQPVTADPA
jgi:antitoxin ParD1/3/4